MLMNFFIEKLTEESYPKVDPKKCIHLNKIPQECNKCRDICSKNAVIIKSNKIEFDEKLCNKCGACRTTCPTEAISMKGLGEENILRTIKDKDNIIFSCSKKDGVGTLKLSCLNAFHPELLAALFILYGDKKFYFNISRCKNCEVNSGNDLLILSSINKAEKFVELIGLKAEYEIIISEENLKNLPKSIISRRDLLLLIKKESSNLATQTIDTIISDKDDYLSIRKILLKSLEQKKDLVKDINMHNTPFFACWDVNNNCNGCGLCQSVCPQEAFKVEKGEEKLNIYHNSGKCHKCGICVDICKQKAIVEGNLSIEYINSYDFKNEINLSTCSACNNKFVPDNTDKVICSICEKKELLRSRIAAI